MDGEAFIINNKICVSLEIDEVMALIDPDIYDAAPERVVVN